MDIKENISLANYSTLRVGGPARFFCKVKSENELKEALSFAKKKSVPFIVLGGGTNMYFSDRGFQGLVIHMELNRFSVKEETDTTVLVCVSAGVVWDDFVERMVSHGFYGLENLSYIPGTVGASPVQNIGAYGAEVKDCIEALCALDTVTFEKKKFSNRACHFSYRDSFFKTQRGKRFIITNILFRLEKKYTPNLVYKDLQTFFEDKDKSNITAKDVREAVIAIRKKKLPSPKKLGTLGSFFKNPIVSNVSLQKLRARYPELVSHETQRGKQKLSAAWLIDHICGLRDTRVGNVGTYPTQPLAIVHYGGGNAHEVRGFSEEVRQIVKKETGITLEDEVQFIEG